MPYTIQFECSTGRCITLLVMVGLTDETKATLAKYRMEKAYTALTEGKLLFENEFYSGAVSKLYYACYYAASALLIKSGFASKTHAGVKGLLGEHFVKTGKLTKDEGRYFSTLFEKRHANDYEDFIETNKEEAEVFVRQAEIFVNSAEKIVKG